MNELERIIWALILLAISIGSTWAFLRMLLRPYLITCYECGTRVHEVSPQSRCCMCEYSRGKFNLRENVVLRDRIAELEEWIVAIADDHPNIPDWIQGSARSLLAQELSDERNNR